MEAETTAERNRRLYGRPRIPRSHRRVMLALLAADGLSGYPLSRLAQAGPGAVYVVLDRLERRGWVRGDWEIREDTRPRRRFYALTPEGRASVALLLGLPAEAPRLAPREDRDA